ncbi:MAG: thioesterase domain-containing protein [Gammaproteobacteria bacterium]|nr:thioesterase domain-containing protein [Gammaproteobacteria bacterium]
MQALHTDSAGAVARLQNYLDTSIPLVKQMGVKVESLDENTLKLFAPLQPNINHIGTAFGGSLNGLATLACWGLVWLLTEDMPNAQIVIHESTTRYLLPVKNDFHACCAIPDASEIEKFMRGLKKRNMARIELTSTVYDRETKAAAFSGSFVATGAKNT